MRHETLLLSLPALLLVAVDCALHLPPYIKACKRTDPKFDDCALKNGREAMPFILNGDPKYRIPGLNPLKITKIEVADRGLNITMNNILVWGLKDVDFIAARTDITNNKFEWDFFAPRLELAFDYKISGRVLVLPISGSGPGNFTLTDVPLTFKYGYILKKKGDGKQYLDINQALATFNTSRVYITLDNLFNGDKFLGDNTNAVLNENWKDVTQDVGPLIIDGITKALRQIIGGIADDVPYDEIYPL